MKQTLNKDMFRFQMNQIRPNNFSYEGQGVLFYYLDEIDSELEFDPIAICCDFSQCSLDEFLDAFNDIDATKEMDDDQKRVGISEFIEMHGFWFSFVEDGKEIIFENF
jgi:hypothetical protein